MAAFVKDKMDGGREVQEVLDLAARQEDRRR
jgi:hypothetical protein